MDSSTILSRRSLLGGAGAAALALATVGCSGGSDSGYGQAKGNVPDKYAKRTRVVLWSAYSGKPGKTLSELAQKFNDSQDEVYVEVQFQGTYDQASQKTAAAIQAKQIPDLVTFSEVTWHRFYLNDLLEPLDGYFTGDFAKSVYQEQLLSEGVLKGKTWWLPFARSTPLFYYNKTLFAKAGLPDRGPNDWDEWYGWSKQLAGLRVSGKQVKMECYQKVDGDWQFQGSVWQWGGAYSDGLTVTINKPEAVAAAEWQRKLIFDDKIAYMADSPTTDFSNQLVATVVTSTGSLSTALEAAKKGGWEVGTAFVPGKVAQVVPTGGGGLSILRYATSKRKKAAFSFIKFLADPANAAYWCVQTGYMPAVREAVNDPQLASLLKANPNYNVAVEQLAKVRKEDEVRLMVPNSNVMIYTGLQKIWSDNAPAQGVFDTVASQLTKATDQVKAQIEKHV
jgi:sn-glycerol 3-phosphate transport system substrate-binding protein